LLQSRPIESTSFMPLKFFTLLVSTCAVAGYLVGRRFGPIGLLVEVVAVLLLTVVMSRNWTNRPLRRVVQDIVVAVAITVGVTFAAARLGVRHYRDQAIASIDRSSRLLAAVQLELASRAEYKRHGDLPEPWGEVEARRFDNGEYWVRFHEEWRMMRRGLVYYRGNTWIKNGKMGSMHAEKVRDDWYLFY
jgi:hypothetical protein